MSSKQVPFDSRRLEEILARFPTPFHIYDEQAILDNARELKSAFAWNPGFKEYFAVKAAPNPYLLKILHDRCGFGADCSSLPELLLSRKTGLSGEEIMFTSNDTPAEEYAEARELGAVINLDDITHIPFLQDACGMPDLICFRYNPGPLRGGNAIIGTPEEAKYGFTRDQLFEGYKMARDMGATRFGLHTMVASNELDPQFFIDTADMLFDLAVELDRELGIRLEFVNLGGGIGIPYRPEESAVDLSLVGNKIEERYTEKIVPAGLDPLKIFLECGRMITGPYGYLVTRAIHTKDTYKKYIGTDACMSDLMRPALYGAYHHITVLGKENAPADRVYDVTGSLCENNDKFAVDRRLPEIVPGDILVIHDAGAHGHAMGFNYNGKLRSAELLLRTDGSVVSIRRPETVDDYFATLDLDGLKSFS